MADIKNIIAVIVASVILLGGLTAFVMYKNGEISALTTTVEDGAPVPGPITDNKINITNDNQDGTMNDTTGTNPRVTFKTNQGDIVLEMYQDLMPVTVGNFIKLASENFYDGTKFHRVIDGFMIQGGDPNSKGDDPSMYGSGGPGYTIQDEFVADAKLSNVRGTIAMANTGQPNSGGSQFFINTADNVNLDFDKEPFTSKHPVFGRVVEGMGIVDLISKTPTGSRDVPTIPVVIEDIVVE